MLLEKGKKILILLGSFFLFQGGGTNPPPIPRRKINLNPIAKDHDFHPPIVLQSPLSGMRYRQKEKMEVIQKIRNIVLEWMEDEGLPKEFFNLRTQVLYFPLPLHEVEQAYERLITLRNPSLFHKDEIVKEVKILTPKKIVKASQDKDSENLY